MLAPWPPGVPLSGDGIGAACDAQELPLTKEDCKKDGWKRFDGTATFRNQVDCSFPVPHPYPLTHGHATGDHRR